MTTGAQLIESIRFDPNELSLPSSVDGFQKVLEDAITPGLFIVKSGFQICDKETGELFGLNGKDDFGEAYGIGILTSGGLVLSDEIVRPWRYNDKFRKYEEKYDPIFTQPMYRLISKDAQLSQLELDIASGNLIEDSTLYILNSPNFDKAGFNLDDTTGKQTGWTVWFTPNDSENLSDSESLDFIIQHQELEIPNRSKLLDIDHPETDKQLLGGIFIVPEICGPGILQFRLSGIAVHTGGKWTLSFPVWETKDESVEKTTPEVKENKDDTLELTPINANNEKGKAKSKKDNKKKKK